MITRIKGFSLILFLLISLHVFSPLHAIETGPQPLEPIGSAGAPAGSIPGLQAIDSQSVNNQIPSIQLASADPKPSTSDSGTATNEKDTIQTEALPAEEPAASPMTLTVGQEIEKAAIEIEKPAPENTVFTGAATYKIPIKTPPGRNGVQPELSLIYNSFQQNGWTGVGWNLDMGSIRRATKRGVNYGANEFVYEKNGALKELAQRNYEWGSGYYGEKIEEAFSKYYFNSSTQGWEVTAKDGTLYSYGSSSGTRQDSAYGIFRWCLDKIGDTNGNTMTLTYFKNQGEIYLDKIEYTGNVGQLPANRVQLVRETRNDVSVSYKTRAQVATAYRLNTIEIYAQEQLVRKYELSYVSGTTSGRSRLAQVQEIGADGVSTLPAEVFGGLAGGNGAFGSQFNSTLQSSNGAVYAPDIDGDGLMDLVTMFIYEGSTPDRVFTHLSNGNGAFGPAIPFNVYFNDEGQQFFADVNGDGLADLIDYVLSPTLFDPGGPTVSGFKNARPLPI